MDDQSTALKAEPDVGVMEALRQYWGFEALRPMQAQAIAAGLAARDSLVVMPTGGGKSLCYQVPPVVANRTDVVVSPLIALMKDQVDGLRQAGYPAAALHSGLTSAERTDAERGVAEGRYKLLFVAPERLLAGDFLARVVERLNVTTFAIDEAHCISQWGHDFRKEYRQLATLKKRFPQASVHAFTATATTRVQRDIVEQLGLVNAQVLVGGFDRPNLVYRILPLNDLESQVAEALQRHRGEAAIVYCISRKDTESMALALQHRGIRAAHYHAGLIPSERSRVQEAFAAEKIDVVVATVAFGMGIDRSNVRCVIHAALPKTIEHYQQETGRAGRDGLEAECVLFYSARDVIRWERLIELSAEKAEQPGEVIAAQRELLNDIRRFCQGRTCRHKQLVAYFGQQYDRTNCGACDICLGDVEGVENATVLAQKILSAVARCEQRFGIGHIVDVLRGANTATILALGHDKLSTHGLLESMPKEAITAVIYQLVDQGVLERTPGDRPILMLNDVSRLVMRGEREVHLMQTRAKVAKARGGEADWEGVDRDLFEKLRQWRKGVAEERTVPAFVILSDAVLRDVARIKPRSLAMLKTISGIGERKATDFGAALVDMVVQHGVDTGAPVSPDVFMPTGLTQPLPAKRPSGLRLEAMNMLRRGDSIEAVMEATGRARSTIEGYLVEVVEEDAPKSIDIWVSPEVQKRILDVAAGTGADRLKPIHEALGGEIGYTAIRLVLAHAAAGHMR